MHDVVRTAAVRRLAALLASAALLVGCGDDSSGFADGYTAVTADYRNGLADAQSRGQAATGGGLDQVLEVYGDVRDVTHEAAQGYAGLSAPGGADEQFAEVRAAVQAQADALDDVLAAARSGSGGQVQAALTAYARALADWGAARQQLEARLDQDPARAGPQ